MMHTIRWVSTLSLVFVFVYSSKVDPLGELARQLYKRVIKYMSWPSIKRFKKHKGVAHLHNVPEGILQFRKR